MPPAAAGASCWISRRLRLGLATVFVAVVALARYGHPLRFYITPHCPQCPPVAALKLRLVPVTASRPSCEGNRRYVKWPSLESVAQPSAHHGRWHALRAAVCAPLWLSWHLGIGQALRAVCLVSGLRPVMWCVPPPTLVLRRCAASALRAGLPVRPPRGLPQPSAKTFTNLLGTRATFKGSHPKHVAPMGPQKQKPGTSPGFALTIATFMLHFHHG